MTFGGEESFDARRLSRRVGSTAAVAALAVLQLAASTLLAGCARSLAERAVAARGGALTTLSRDVEARVHQGFPGTWRWRVEQRAPDLLRWTLETYGEEQTFSWDGERVRFFLGSASLPPDPAAAGDFRSIVRWTAVTSLGALAQEDQVEVAEIPPAELPFGAAGGLRVRYRDDGATYDVYLDARDLVVGARGPVSVPAVGAGEMSARFSEFRDVAGYVLPYAGSYVLGGESLFEERILRWTVNDPALDADAFRTAPPRLPR